MVVQQKRNMTIPILERSFWLLCGEWLKGEQAWTQTWWNNTDKGQCLDGHCISEHIPEILRGQNPKDLGMRCGQQRDTADSQTSDLSS